MITPCVHLLAICANDCFIVGPKFQAKFEFEVDEEVFILLPILGILSAHFQQGFAGASLEDFAQLFLGESVGEGAGHEG